MQLKHRDIHFPIPAILASCCAVLSQSRPWASLCHHAGESDESQARVHRNLSRTVIRGSRDEAVDGLNAGERVDAGEVTA
ncbi:MAG: hypothetical protein RI967_660 [Planctomycetota bacterium]|jgi:hypothetical protein